MNEKSSKAAGAIEGAAALDATKLVDYGEGAVVSRTVAKGPGGTMTLFAFDEGQELSEHSAPFDAYVLVLEGEAVLTVGGEPVRAKAGQLVLMPANVPHAVAAPTRFKMQLVMFKEPAPQSEREVSTR